MTKRLMADKEPAPLYSVTLAGAIAGVCYWGFFYPLEVVKTRIQCEPSDFKKRKYKSSLGCLVKIYKEEGMRALWRGYIPGVLRAATVNAGIFTGVVYTKRRLLM